jgi:hypothetical protein
MDKQGLDSAFQGGHLPATGDETRSVHFGRRRAQSRASDGQQEAYEDAGLASPIVEAEYVLPLRAPFMKLFGATRSSPGHQNPNQSIVPDLGLKPGSNASKA